ncbi:hypothetical protein EDD29_4742 [Actinocorallia herbida]|uniref:Uncharacterized protein n=1 Tax=Actinocorallia herbida TaxID=58109 RepID=A0A3N1D0W0_9ACTN|nr:hypothetical protein [Actinocorallia herbida]ROO87150.1 hypothetical protein EDD29_4742 [Actinocorallia herbida]
MIPPRDEGDGEWEDDDPFSGAEVEAALAEAGAAADREAALGALLHDPWHPAAAAAACLVSARHSGVGFFAGQDEWLAAHRLEPTPELIAAARPVLRRLAPLDDLFRLSLANLDGERFAPVLGELPGPPDGEKAAKSYVKNLRTGGFLTSCGSPPERAAILWCTARAAELLDRPVEVTFRGLAAHVFIPGLP